MNEKELVNQILEEHIINKEKIYNNVIETVGETGMATGSPLEFPVTVDDVPIYPETIFSE